MIPTKPVLIFDMIIFYLQNKGGGSRIWAELLNEIYKSIEIKTINYNIMSNNFYLKSNLKKIIQVEQIEKYPLIISRFLTIKINKQPNNTLFHSSYFRTIDHNIIPKNRCFTTIHDLTTDKYDNQPRKNISILQREKSIRNSGSIVCISNATKKELMHKYPGIELQKDIRVIHHGISECYFHSNNEKNPILENNEEYILYVGTRYKYKNFEYFTQVINETKNKIKKAIVVGGGPLNKSEKKLIMNNKNIKWEFIPKVSDEELRNLYRNALCLLYPSSSEGFGLPVIEAAACGCPVLCQKLEAIYEIAKDYPHYININSINYTIRIIEELIKSKNKNDYVLNGQKISNKYKWENAGKKLIDFYMEKID